MLKPCLSKFHDKLAAKQSFANNIDKNSKFNKLSNSTHFRFVKFRTQASEKHDNQHGKQSTFIANDIFRNQIQGALETFLKYVYCLVYPFN
jgi:hypothetical protein